MPNNPGGLITVLPGLVNVQPPLPPTSPPLQRGVDWDQPLSGGETFEPEAPLWQQLPAEDIPEPELPGPLAELQVATGIGITLGRALQQTGIGQRIGETQIAGKLYNGVRNVYTNVSQSVVKLYNSVFASQDQPQPQPQPTAPSPAEQPKANEGPEARPAEAEQEGTPGVAENVEQHHIMTNKNNISTAAGGPYTPKFEELAEKRGIDLNDAINKMSLPDHQGPHPEYNAAVYRSLDAATEGLDGNAFNQAFDKAMQQIRAQTATPGTPLNKLATGG